MADTLPGLPARLAEILRRRLVSVRDIAIAIRRGRLRDLGVDSLPAITVAHALHPPTKEIPRAVCRKVLRGVQRAVGGRRLTELVGSYRRGKEHPRDVDVLTTAPLAAIDLSRIGEVLAVYAAGDAKRSAIIEVK